VLTKHLEAGLLPLDPYHGHRDMLLEPVLLLVGGDAQVHREFPSSYSWQGLCVEVSSGRS